MVVFTNCTPVSNCIGRINNTLVDDAYADVVMSMYNSIEYGDVYSKTSRTLWQYCRDKPALAANGDFDGFNTANANTNLFNLKAKITGQTGENDTKNVEILLQLKKLSNFWRTLEISLINWENNIDLNWYKMYVIVASNIDR